MCGRIVTVLAERLGYMRSDSGAARILVGTNIMNRIGWIGAVTFAALALGGTAKAADMPVKAPMAPPPPPVFTWQGFYIGAHVGYGWQSVNSQVFESTGALTDTLSFDRSGILGGGQVGFNWQVAPNWVLGIEGDVSGADIHGTNSACTATGCASSNTKFDELATIRGRVGYAFNTVLLYGTGGWAWSHSSTARTVTCVVAGGGVCPGGPSPSALTGQVATASGSQDGWVAGGGIEWGFMPSWTAKLEYQHLQFDNLTRNFAYAGFPTASRRIVTNNSTDTVRVGLNYKFH